MRRIDELWSKDTSHFSATRELFRHLLQNLRRAFAEFLNTPTIVIIGLLILAFVMHATDLARPTSSDDWWGGLFGQVQAARAFLGTIAGSIITVTSITFSLLLIAVQQGASALTSLVFDQFLRRRTNQVYFGFFIGLALYCLVGLATINPSHRPVYSVAVAGLLTIVALYMLIVLIYTTINQMRPVVIIRSIHDHTLLARERQLELLRKTRRAPRLGPAATVTVVADDDGFFTGLNIGALEKALANQQGAEIVILVSIGDYVAFGEQIAELRMVQHHDIRSLETVVRNAIKVEEQRNLDTDPAFGIEQLATIGWTSVSTAKSNPGPGLLVIQNLRDILARWLGAGTAFDATDPSTADPRPVVYRDNVPERLLKAFESLVVVASESMQHQSAAEIYRTFASLFHRLPEQQQQQADDLLLRSLSGLGDHILTSDLQSSLTALADAMRAAGRYSSTAAIHDAGNKLEMSIGRLNSRSTRTQNSSEVVPENGPR